MESLLIGVIVVVMALIGLILLKKKQASQDNCGTLIAPAAVLAYPASEPEPAPSMIAIVDDMSRPLVTVEAVSNSLTAFKKAAPVSEGSESISRLSALVQAAPAVLTAASASGKQLMEVVVNGELVRAADGNGFRAIAMGAKGVKEHARLFEVKNLQNIINAAAVWQVASVIVAQKHLADINRKLDDIKDGVQSISSFLNEQRRARVQSTYDYLQQAHSALTAGELSASVRHELESCERDLSEILLHLQQEYLRIVDRRTEHKETFGTEDLMADIRKKLDRLEQLARDIEMCAKTRIAAWHVLSLYPGEPRLKEARKQSIERAIESLQGLVPRLSGVLLEEINSMKSFWNREKTLEERKASLRGSLNNSQTSLNHGLQSVSSGVRETSTLLLKHDQPARMWLEFENGVLTQAREELLAA